MGGFRFPTSSPLALNLKPQSPKLSILNPESYAPDPQPKIIHPEPDPLRIRAAVYHLKVKINLKPQSLKLSILNPKSYAPDPQTKIINP